MVRTTTRNDKPMTGKLSTESRDGRGHLVYLREHEETGETGFGAGGEDGMESIEAHRGCGGGDVDVGFLDKHLGPEVDGRGSDRRC